MGCSMKESSLLLEWISEFLFMLYLSHLTCVALSLAGLGRATSLEGPSVFHVEDPLRHNFRPTCVEFTP